MRFVADKVVVAAVGAANFENQIELVTSRGPHEFVQMFWATIGALLFDSAYDLCVPAAVCWFVVGHLTGLAAGFLGHSGKEKQRE